LHGLNTFDDDNDAPLFDEPPRRPSRDRTRRPQRSGPRRPGSGAGSNSVLRLAGLVALGILIVFGFVLWVGSCSGRSTQSYTSYIDAMQPLAKSSAAVGKEFATALGTPGLTMRTFQSDLARWSQQEQNAYVTAQRLQPPGLLQSPHAQALAAFQLRYAGLERLASTLTLAQQKHVRGAIVAGALAGNAQLLSASDTVWDQLFRIPATDVLTAQNVTGVIVPPSRIVTDAAIVSAPELATFYERLATPSSGHGASGTHNLELLGSNAVDSGNSLPLSTTLPLTVKVGPNLVIDVVFKNSGSSPEVKIPVTLAVKAGGKILPGSTETKTVAQVAAGAQATVSFRNPQVPNTAYSRNGTAFFVKVGAVPRETNLSDNFATYPVFFQIAP
jgi:hypothetical protein